MTLSGELDVAGAGQLDRELDRLLADHAPSAVAFDLSGLAFMDSTGLRQIVLADARSREGGWTLSLVAGPPDVHRVFEITRMTDRLRFVASSAEVTG